MKKTTITLLVLIALSLTGCNDKEELIENRQKQILYCPTDFEYRGHRYIYFSNSMHYEGGVVHDPDCQCRGKGGQND